MTRKQTELLTNMYKVLDSQMDFGTIGKKKQYTSKEAYTIISLNKEAFYGIMDEG